jgi:hypothetical protein
MAVAVIGTILAGIGWVLGKTWDGVKGIVDWFILVVPPPIKFFLFLYMILFMSSAVIPPILNISVSCDSKGNAYNIDIVTLWTETDRVDGLADMCLGTTAPEVKPLSFITDLMAQAKWIYRNIVNAIKIFGELKEWRETGNSTAIVETAKLCHEFSLVNTTYSNDFSRDYALQYYGRKIVSTDAKNAIHVGCALNSKGEYHTTLKFFDLDIFNFEMWLLLGVCSMLIIFAMNWYKITLNR